MSKKKIVTIIVTLIVFLALVGGVVWLFMSGKLVWAGSGVGQSANTVVCESDIVNRYNDASSYVIRGDSDEPSVDEGGLKNIKSDIKEKSGYEKDATCQSILYLMAIYEDDYEGSKTAYEAVKELHDKNIFSSNNIAGNSPLFMYEAGVYMLSEEGIMQEGIGDSE